MNLPEATWLPIPGLGSLERTTGLNLLATSHEPSGPLLHPREKGWPIPPSGQHESFSPTVETKPHEASLNGGCLSSFIHMNPHCPKATNPCPDLFLSEWNRAEEEWVHSGVLHAEPSRTLSLQAAEPVEIPGHQKHGYTDNNIINICPVLYNKKPSCFDPSRGPLQYFKEACIQSPGKGWGVRSWVQWSNVKCRVYEGLSETATWQGNRLLKLVGS